MLNVYAINVCTDTKTTDIYEKVAVNPYPIIAVGHEGELREQLSSQETKDYIKKLFRIKALYDAAVFRIRWIDKNYEVREIEWPVTDICEVEY